MKNFNLILNSKNIPNGLSVFRIIFSVFLIPLMSDKTAFIMLYLLLGLSDFLDGYIARKYKYESNFGAKLDSSGDLVFYITLMWIYYLSYNKIILANINIIAIIVIIRFGSMLISFMKNKKIAFLHTILNKISGLIIYIFPVAMYGFENKSFIKVVLFIALIAAIEEMFIIIVFRNPDVNIKSIFNRN